MRNKRRLKDRFNEHRRTLDNANTKSKPTSVAEHFLSSPHNIEKIFSNRDSIRKAREALLISKGRTIDPNGLNPLATGDLAEKHVLKLVEGFFGHCRAV